MSEVRFTKMHGLGNDYIYVDTESNAITEPSACSVEWSRYHTGIGSDGLVLIGKSKVADFSQFFTAGWMLGIVIGVRNTVPSRIRTRPSSTYT